MKKQRNLLKSNSLESFFPEILLYTKFGQDINIIHREFLLFSGGIERDQWHEMG